MSSKTTIPASGPSSEEVRQYREALAESESAKPPLPEPWKWELARPDGSLWIATRLVGHWTEDDDDAVTIAVSADDGDVHIWVNGGTQLQRTIFASAPLEVVLAVCKVHKAR